MFSIISLFSVHVGIVELTTIIDSKNHYSIGIYKGRGLLAVRLKRGPLHASVRKAVSGSERRVHSSRPRADPERTQSAPGVFPKFLKTNPKWTPREPGSRTRVPLRIRSGVRLCPVGTVCT